LRTRLVPGFVSMIWLVWLSCQFLHAAPPPQQKTADPVAPAAASQRALLDKYCVACHSDKLRTSGLSLQSADLAKVPENAEVWEKVIRKLRANAMPPQGLPRPDQPATDALVKYLETSIDQQAQAHPDPGRSPLHRLNRTEYKNAVRDLLGLDVDVVALLPPDDESYGFDNIADVLRTSPALLERYLSASWKIGRLAVGDAAISPDTATYRVKPDLSQDGHLEGLPLGTRGGISVQHTFPLDGEYEIRVRLWRPTTDIIRGIASKHQVEISIDGERVKLVSVGGKEDAEASYKAPGISAADIDQRLTVRVPVKAGPRTVVATFLTRSEAQEDDVLEPFIRTNLDPVGYQGQPVVDRVSITGPFNGKTAENTPSRQRIFVCHPASPADEIPCAKKIFASLASRAYRRPANDTDVERMLTFYQRRRNKGGDFEGGIESAIQLILASPEFLYRFESDPDNMPAGGVRPLTDFELASRLSFFLWSAAPDDELLKVAGEKKLHDPRVLEQQVRRLLQDPKSVSLTDNFAGQWLFLRNLKSVNPDFESFPDFDDNLRQAMKHETELLFGSVVREDRPVLDLLNADYTFVNERLARHYGIKGIYGNDFQRVPITDENRRGLLGQASILTVTSYATRTSPVERGKWILTNLIGLPPNPPPPNVPALKEHADAGQVESLRQRMEAHRASPVCAGCHKVMDPIGFSLENFDAVGQWRDTDEGAKIDPSGVMFTGDKVSGPASLRQALLKRPEVFVGVVTEKLMTYALGRGVEYYDMPAIRAVLQRAAKDDYRWSSLVMGIVESTPFQMKKKSPEGEGQGQSVVASAAQ